MRLIAAALACVVLFACSTDGNDPVAGSSSSPLPTRLPITTDQGGVHRRGPGGIDLVFEAGRFEQRIFRGAVKDLVRIDAWAPLTKGLHSLELETHPGARSRAGVHLADAVLGHTIVEGKPRVVCDIRFYPHAIRQELRIWRRVRGVGFSPDQWRDYNENGVFDEELPTKAHFWASILAHELAHCLVGRHGEKAAQQWEYRTMRRLKR